MSNRARQLLGSTPTPPSRDGKCPFSPVTQPVPRGGERPAAGAAARPGATACWTSPNPGRRAPVGRGLATPKLPVRMGVKPASRTRAFAPRKDAANGTAWPQCRRGSPAGGPAGKKSGSGHWLGAQLPGKSDRQVGRQRDGERWCRRRAQQSVMENAGFTPRSATPRTAHSPTCGSSRKGPAEAPAASPGSRRFRRPEFDRSDPK
jgi:hypothetical protein